MKTFRLLTLLIFLVTFSGACYKEDAFSGVSFHEAFHETVNLGTRITISGNIGCSQGALTQVTDNKLIVGAVHPQSIELNTKSVTDIAINSEGLFHYALVKATETHLWNIYYLQNAFQLKVLDMSTGAETILVDLYGTYYGGYSHDVQYAVNNDDIVYNKANGGSTDSIIYRKNLHNNNSPEIALPIKGNPISLSQSGNSIIHLAQSGYYQYDFVSQQSSFLSRDYYYNFDSQPPVMISPFDIGNDKQLRQVFLVKDIPFIIYSHSGSGPLYIRKVSGGNEVVLYDPSYVGAVKISPDEERLCYWAVPAIIGVDGLEYNAYELLVYTFETQEVDTIYRVEQHRYDFLGCHWTTPDISANFSPDSKNLIYLVEGQLYQYLLPL